MLTTHLDKEIYVDAQRHFKSDPIKNSKDFIHFLREGSHVVLHGISADLDESTINIMSELLEGRGESATITTRSNSFSILHSGIYTNNPYQVFFLNIRDKQEQFQVKNQLNLLVGFIDNYNTVFNELKNERSFRIDVMASKNKFTDWQQILPKIPVTDIIISDPYMLEENEHSPLSENLYKLVEALKACYHDLNNLTVFTKISNIQQLSVIREEIRQITGYSINVATVLFQTEATEHDRHIFTNYHHIKLGSSLNFLFDTSGKLNVRKKSSIKVESYWNSDNFEEAEPILTLLSKLFEAKKSELGLPEKLRSRLYYGG